jgi:parallel beta-helix repeat protein
MGKKIISVILASAVILAVTPLNLDAKSYLYVDDDAEGEMDGSYGKPYKKIQDALDKAAKDDKYVSIRKGIYRENIEIWEDLKVYGVDRDDVVITAKNDDEPTVIMHDDTTLGKVTVKDGERGILVEEGDGAVISDCKIVDNDKDGIKAEKADRKEKDQLEVYDCYIADNGWNGIYAESRKSNIKDNKIYFNDRDGIELEDDSEASIEDNRLKENGGDGLKITIDWSEIWIEDNTFYNNDREGLEIRSSHQKEGEIGVKENKFYKNDRWGVARIEKEPFCDSQWDSSVYFDKNIFSENKQGEISSVINVY